ncbi:MAG TPA: class I SAM-dependent methyltransferase [Candidatus Solibacter sp.]|jgi:SAM-dependent methyltransferase|nr:class I SAM-dependent methyltransferase [Candidatus Solibacter sp.]
MTSFAPNTHLSERIGQENPLASVESVDRLNAEFYSRFPYPPLAAKFDYLEDPDFERVMLCQSIGDFTHRRLPRDSKIWVVGCGTNQAIQTALRFPEASVLGTDLSAATLELSSRVAGSINVENLTLRQQSIAAGADRDHFDYILCTGVIHHNADPAAALSTLAAALKPDGILELMVYNSYHRTLPIAFQEAVQILGKQAGRADFSDDIEIARALIKSVPGNTPMGQWLTSLEERSESDIADLLIQPVEHTYTVESLASLAKAAGLELLIPTVSPLMKYRNLPCSWDLDCDDFPLRETYEKLPDVMRWQMGNLLLNDQSPMLWFYLQRQNSPFPRKSEQEVCDAFMAAAWAPARTLQRNFVRDEHGSFRLSPKSIPYPLSRPELALKEIVDHAEGKESMRAVWQHLGWQPSRTRVNEARVKLATSASPFLRAVN